MTCLPWYAGGAALMAVLVLHWLWLRRMMAVSGRYTALVDRVRFGATDDGASAMSTEEILAAVRAATGEAFGAQTVDAAPPPEPASVAAPQAPITPAGHLLFFTAIAAGGLVSALLRGGIHPEFSLRGDIFARVTHGSPAVASVFLVLGGALVGFGTRMAGGCTTGHGLCGVSRFQKGSLLSTAAFFGAGVGVSLLLGRLT